MSFSSASQELPRHRLDSTPPTSPVLAQVLDKLSAQEEIENTLGPMLCWGHGQGEKQGQNPWPPDLSNVGNCLCKEALATGKELWLQASVAGTATCHFSVFITFRAPFHQ